MTLDPETYLKLERVVDAPRDLLWLCWTTPEHIKNFFIPAPHKVTECDLDLRGNDAGDGPAVLVILALGAIIMMLVFWVEFRYEPPWWLHVLIWLPVTFGLATWMLRFLKALLVAQQYIHRSTALDE